MAQHSHQRPSTSNIRRRRRSLTGVFAPLGSGDAPTIVSLDVLDGSSLGGSSVVITGTNFQAPGSGVATVTFDGSAASGVTILSDTTLSLATPAGSPGTADVVFINANGTDSLAAAFTYFPIPVVTSATPDDGSSLGGLETVIAGTGFVDDGAEPNFVTIDGAQCTSVVTDSDIQITCDVPAGTPSGLTDVIVTNNNGVTVDVDDWTYFPTPTISGITVSSGSSLGSLAVFIAGTGFTANGAQGTSVTIGGTAGTSVILTSNTRIDFDTPSGTAGSVQDVVISSSNGSATLAAGFTYFAAPVLTSITPDQGDSGGGAAVTIVGTGFQDNLPGTNSVLLNGFACTSVVVVSDTEITCVTPSGAPDTVAGLELSNDNGTGSIASAYSYFTAPTVTAIVPDTDDEVGGAAVSITGTGFSNNTPGPNTVTLVGAGAFTSVIVISDTFITAIVPAGSGMTLDVTVSNLNGTGTGIGIFTYNVPPGNDTLIAIDAVLRRVRRRWSSIGVYRRHFNGGR